jgi:AsmA protein
VAAVVALVLILFLFRPGVYKLRNRISDSIGSALGRKVELDNVQFHLLPRPGFALEGLVIYDAPEFSAEPMIRAQDVSAAIRFRSLLRGRLEIATLSATEPSINLVRNDEGRWNLASLLERNAQIPAAPTGKPASERRPAFPYLEATGARINFKLGQTKKSYALINADVALWQESENSWGARLKAEPVRTDFNLTDTGLVQINATWQRAPNLRLTPVEIAAQWKNGQLGQITKLLSGRDRGWRGGVTFTAKISGTPEALQIETRTAIDGFRRYDIAGSENVRLATVCSGQYNTVTSTLADLLCESPVSSGTACAGTWPLSHKSPPTTWRSRRTRYQWTPWYDCCARRNSGSPAISPQRDC